MKYLIILASGAADDPIPELDGKTPLDAARTPGLDALAVDGKTGLIATQPDDLAMAEEVALLGALGYDPHAYFTGEAGLAAAAFDTRIGPERIAVRHNLATEADGAIADHAAGQITVPEAQVLVAALQGALDRPDVTFHVGRGFAGVTIVPSVRDGVPACVSVAEAMGRPTDEILPSGEGAEILRRIVNASREVFVEHDINRVRADLDENPATLFWPWGAGRPPVLPSFESRFKLTGAVVAAHESARGIGRLAGMEVPNVAEATGTYKTNYAAKAECALEVLNTFDLVVIHAASPGDASLDGNAALKRQLIEDIDAHIVQPALDLAARSGDMRILFLATRHVATTARHPTRNAVPLAMFGPGVQAVRHARLSEAAAAEGELVIAQGHTLLQYFLRP